MNTNYSGIKTARILKKMSQSELAIAMNVDVFTINEWEKGIGVLSLNNLLNLAQILEVSTNLLLFNENRNPLNLDKLNEKQRNEVINLYNLIQSINK